MSILYLTCVNVEERDGDTLGAPVPKRPQITAKRFGAWLERKRGGRSLERIARQVRPLVEPLGLKVGAPLLYKIEHGRVPQWPLVGALAKVYHVPMQELVARLIAGMEFPGSQELFFGEELNIGKSVQNETVQNSTLDPDSRPLIEGQHGAPSTSHPTPDERDAIIAKARAAAVDLLTILAPRAETPSPRAKESRRRPSR